MSESACWSVSNRSTTTDRDYIAVEGRTGARGALAVDQARLLDLLARLLDDLLDEGVEVARIGRLTDTAPQQLVLAERIDQRLDGDDGVGLKVAGRAHHGPAVVPVAIHRRVG